LIIQINLIKIIKLIIQNSLKFNKIKTYKIMYKPMTIMMTITKPNKIIINNYKIKIIIHIKVKVLIKIWATPIAI